MQMLEFNLFLIDYWYFSVPLFLAVIFAAVSEKMDYRFDDFIHSEEE